MRVQKTPMSGVTPQLSPTNGLNVDFIMRKYVHTTTVIQTLRKRILTLNKAL